MKTIPCIIWTKCALISRYRDFVLCARMVPIMAIYHLHAQMIQRSKGKNTVAAAAYRRAAKLYDEKEGRVGITPISRV